MWTCKVCRINFGFESIEHHVYANHLKPNHLGGAMGIKVYNCGECMYVATEGFEDIARHCMNLGHEPTRVNKGLDYDEYASRLFIALGDILCPKKTTPVAEESVTPARYVASSTYNTTTTETDIMRYKEEDQSDSFSVYDHDGIDWSDSATELLIPTQNNQQPLSETLGILESTADTTLNNDADNTTKTAPRIGRDNALLPFSTDNKTHNDSVSIDGSEREACEKSIPALPKRSRTEGSNHDATPSTGGTAAFDGRKTTSAFPCPYCSKTLFSTSSAKRHAWTHTKPFQCKTCEKTFSNSSNLLKHERLHSGLKPYSCTFCGRSFADSSNLGKHERVHHTVVGEKSMMTVDENPHDSTKNVYLSH